MKKKMDEWRVTNWQDRKVSHHVLQHVHDEEHIYFCLRQMNPWKNRDDIWVCHKCSKEAPEEWAFIAELIGCQR